MRIKKMLSLFMAMIMILTLLPANVFAGDPTSPTLTKTAEWIDQETGLAKITMTAKGTPIDVTAKSGADVLLVLDTSGSMDDDATKKCGGDLVLQYSSIFGYYYECPECGATYFYDDAPTNLKCTEKVYMDKSRWEIAADAVDELIDQVIPDSNTANRMGTILFSADEDSMARQNYYGSHTKAIKKYQDFTNDKSKIIEACSYSPTGGTDYTGALQKAFDMIDSRTDKSRPVYLIFLSDGAPGGWSAMFSSGNRIYNTDWNGANEINRLKSTSDNNDITIYTVGFSMDDHDAIQLLKSYATKSEYAYNITDGSELSGLFTDIGNTIESEVTIWDTIDSEYFTLANKPETNVKYVASSGAVQCTGDSQFVWNLDNFSKKGETLEIYIQLKSEYINKNKKYPTNKENSAFGKYVSSDGSKVDLRVSEKNGSSAVPTLDVAKTVKVKFNFIGTNKDKASFDVPAEANQSVANGNTVTSPSVTVAPGYQITDWYETGDCTGDPFDFSIPITGNNAITLHARVDKDANAKYAYHVEFYKNGVKSETVDGNVWAGAPSITLGNAKAMKTGNYSNYSFTEAKSGPNSYTQDGDIIGIEQNGSTVIKVYFTAGAVDLTFQRGDHGKFSASGDESKASVTKPTHFDAIFNDTPGVTAELGWQPVGWYETGDIDKNIVTFPLTITGAKTYVMKYEKNTGDWKSVTFYLNNGTSAQHKVVNDILVGNSITPGDWPSKPNRAGYEFNGWFTKDGTKGDWGIQFTQSTKVNETMNVYAKWEKIETDVPVHYYLGSTNGTELTFSQVQQIAGATIGNSYSSYIDDVLKGKGTIATNQNNYYEISSEKATVYINRTLLGTQTVNDGDMIQVVYPAKMGTFKVREYFPDSNPTSEQYLKQYEASLEHGSDLKYGASKTDLTISEINKILDESLSATKSNKPGAKIKSVSIEYQELNPSGIAVWQTPVTATLNATGTAVESFMGLDQLFIHGACETRLTFEYELPIEIRVEYHKQYGDTENYYEIAGKDYVVGGGTNYVFKNDELDIVENADSLNNINKVVPAGVVGYQVVRMATKNAPATPITTNKYKVTSPTTFIVYLDAITADGGKIVNVNNTGAPLEGGEFVFNQTNLTADSNHKNEYPISQDFVYGVEYNVEQTASAPGYDKVSDFKVKLNADGTGLELVGTVENVTVDDMTITVTNDIDANQKFAYTVNRYIKDTETAVPGLPALTGESSLGNFNWTNEATTNTGYKLVADAVQPTSLVIKADATKNTATVYYEVDDSQTRSYKVTYWRDGEATPFDALNNLTVLEADPMVAFENLSMDNIPVGYKLKGVEFARNAFSPNEKVVITSVDNEIKVIYEKDPDMWVNVVFSVGAHGKWANNTTTDVVLDVIKGTVWSNYSSQVPANPVQNEIGWKLADGVWDKPILGDSDLIPDNGLVYTAVWAEDNATVSFEIVGDTHGAENPEDAEVQKGTKTTAPVVTANKGYQVLGWYTDNQCADAFDFNNTTITEDTKLYAKVVEKAEDWTTITFKAGNHGKWADSATEDVVLDVIKGAAWSNYSSLAPANPVQNEIGWKLADGIWDKPILGDSDLIPDNGLVYTAVWAEDMADVTFQIKGIMVEGVEQFFGVVNPDSQSIQKGKTAEDPTATAIANIQRGYKFDGWYTDEECSNAFDFTKAISGNTIVYSKVSVKDEDWARVTFKAGTNGTINDGSGDVATVITDPILIGNTIGRTIPSANANTGYEFNAWYKVTEGESGTEEFQETPTQDTEVLGNMTYLAKFAPLLSVNFSINTTKAAEGTTNPVTISGISNGTPWISIADQVPNVQGKIREDQYSHDYEFTGWNADFPETVTSNLTFTAQFEDIYTFAVEYANINKEDSYPDEEPKHIKRKAGEAISSQAIKPKRGYELTNITVYVDANKLEATTTAELIQKLKDEYDITLTEDGTLSGKMPNNCIWIKYGYEKLAERTVEYVSDGTVKNMPENITDNYKGDEIEISTQKPQRDGYDFGGWKVVDDAVEVTDGTFIMPDSDVKLKAEWTPNEEVWNFTVEHYLEGSDTPFETVPDSVLKREPNIESVVLNAPQGYKFKEYQINGDPTDLPITIGEDGNTISVVYEKNDLMVKHVYGDTTIYDTTQSMANVDAESVVVNAVNSGRYTKLRSVTVNGEPVTSSRNITLDFSETGKYEVVFVYGKKSSDSGDTTDSGGSSNSGSDFGEEVTILDEEVPLADGLNVIDHFAYIFGYKDGTVRPTNRISREEVAAIFYRLLSDDVRESMRSTTQDFPDVLGQRWSNTSIATLSNGGVIAGYPNGEFKPSNSITRAEFAVIVSKFDNLSKADTNQFTDIENHWAKDFINSAALKGWISGYPDGTFHPNDYITRAEAMTLINSVLNRKVSKDGLLENAKYWSDNNEDAWYYEAVMEATNSHDYTRETPVGDETWTAITPDKTWD